MIRSHGGLRLPVILKFKVSNGEYVGVITDDMNRC